jgi:hypothetical protein
MKTYESGEGTLQNYVLVGNETWQGRKRPNSEGLLTCKKVGLYPGRK